MESILVIDSDKCQASFPKWSGCFPEAEISNSINDMAIARPYIARMAQLLNMTTTTTTPVFRGRMVAA